MGYYDWPAIVSRMSDDDLTRIIRDERHEPELKVAAALAELKRRGIDAGNYHKLISNISPEPDESSPVLYSTSVIYTFSILFSVLFGGILFARNLKEINRKEGILPVILFSVLYTALGLYVLNMVDLGTAGTLVFSAIGAIIINNFFWNKYIGGDIVYRKKRYRKPLIIALIIFVPLTAFVIWATIVTGQLPQ